MTNKPARNIACPKCGAPPGKRCVTKTGQISGGRRTSHRERLLAYLQDPRFLTVVVNIDTDAVRQKKRTKPTPQRPPGT